MSNIIVSRTAIASTIADYLGNDEEDVGSKQALVQHQLACAAIPDTVKPQYLHSSQRNKEHIAKIVEAFAKVQKDNCQSWAYNGAVRYGLCGIEETNALKAIIQNAEKGRKEFYVLDIGGGDFRLGHALAEYINKQNDLSSGISVHIINLRGEDYSGEKTI